MPKSALEQLRPSRASCPSALGRPSDEIQERAAQGEQGRGRSSVPAAGVDPLERRAGGLAAGPDQRCRRDRRAPPRGRICTEAGIGDGWTSRELRTTFVSLMSHRGVNIEEIARLAGHASTRTTEIVYRRDGQLVRIQQPSPAPLFWRLQASGVTSCSCRRLAPCGTVPGGCGDGSGEPVLVGVGDGLGSVADAGLGEEMIDMALYRGLADHQPAGDLYVGQSLGDQCEHFGFSLREPGG